MAERYCAENIVFHAGQRTLIDDVSLTLSQGELVALIGPNGAGKSTLLACLPAISNPRADGAVWRERRLRPGRRTDSPATGR
nr:ATP-binding cassette domain-containing protein [Enterobacter cloacae]